MIKSEKAALPVGHFPHARKVGNLVFLSGIGPRDRDTNSIACNFSDQVHDTFKNVRFVLEAAGLNLTHLVDVTVFLTNMKAHFSEFNEIWAQYFPQNPPCRTTVEVGALPTPISFEMKCIAEVRDV